MYGKMEFEAYKGTENSLTSLNNAIENISNINSIGYKKAKTTFVETLNGEIEKHEGKDFSQGALRRTGELYDIALDGPGFFEVEMPNGQRAYTRAGRLRLTGEGELVTEDSYRVVPEVETNGKPVIEVNKSQKDELGLNIKVTTPKLIISTAVTPEIQADGTINGINPETNEKTKIGKINVVVFNNTDGLEHIGRSYYLPTKSSGPAIDADVAPSGTTAVKQGYLEFGNVDMANEFVNLSELKNLLAAQFKLLKIIDKLYENVHYTISRST